MKEVELEMRLIPKRRLRFSMVLSHLVLFMLPSAIHSQTATSNPADEEMISLRKAELEAIRRLAQKHCTVVFSWEDDEDSCEGVVSSLSFYPFYAFDEEVQHASVFPQLREVSLSYCYRISDKSLATIAKIENLRVLDLSYQTSSHAGNLAAAPYGKIPSVEVVSKVSDDGLRQLCILKKLKKLKIAGKKFGQEVVLAIAESCPLEELVVSKGTLSDDAIADLGDTHPNLSVVVVP